MKKSCFWIIFAILSVTTFLTGCDDNTAELGENIMPGKDQISIGTQTYNVRTSSFLAGDSILAKTSKAYLGKYTDPTFGTFEADFLAQFHCVEDFQFPENGVIGDSAVSIEVRLYFTEYFGDPDNACHLSVYPLDSVLQEDINYYTDIVPTDYYDESLPPLASRPYTVNDKTIPDSISESSNYMPYISIPLPNSFGTEIIRKYYEEGGKEYFANAEAFINNVCKGMYVKCNQGDGTILYIDQAQLNIHFRYLEVSSSGVADSAVTVIAQFAGTQEVIQANRFQTDKEALKKLIADGSCTYLKTPAGIFTEIELPMEEIEQNHIASGDTLNSVKLQFIRYNENSDASVGTKFKMGIPQTVLMVRKKDMYSFFEKNQVPDKKTSFIANFDEDYNTYTFNNISQLITTCIAEKENAENEDWNKLVLIPVTVTTDNTSNIVGVRHDLQLNSARLMGGFNEGNELQIQIIYSKFTE